MYARASAEKFPGEATEKRPKSSTIKPLYTISVPSIKIQEGHGSPCPPPAADAHECMWLKFVSSLSSFLTAVKIISNK